MEERTIKIDFYQSSSDPIEQESQEQEQEQLEPQNKLEKELELADKIEEWVKKYPLTSIGIRADEWNSENGSILTREEIYEIRWQAEKEWQKSNPQLDKPKIVKKEAAQKFLDRTKGDGDYIDRAMGLLLNGKHTEISKEIMFWAEELHREGKRPGATEEKEYTLHPSKMSDVHYEPREPIIEGFPLYKELVYLFSGEQGSFKSILLLHILKCIASGEPLFGKYKILQQGPIILFDEETPKSVWEERKVGFGLDNQNLNAYLLHFSGLSVDEDKWVDEVLRVIAEIRPIFVGFDSFIDFHTQDENAPVKMQGVMKRLRKIATAGPALGLISHVSKEAKLTRGTTAIPAAVDMEFTVKANTEREITLEVKKNRIEPFEPIVVVPHFTPSRFWVSCKQTKDEDMWNTVGRILREAGTPMTLEAMLAECERLEIKTSIATLRRIVLEKINCDLVQRVDLDITKPDKNGRMKTYKVQHFTIK